jgi:hypothetical protein
MKPEQVAIINGKVVTDPETGKDSGSGDRDGKKQEISDAYNAGRVKVVIGTTQSAGEGMNLQKTTTDIHHVDFPWTPGAIRQRNNLTDAQYVELVNELIAKQPFAKAIAQEEAKAYDDLQRSVEAMTKQRIQAREEIEKANAGGERTIEQLRDEYVQLTAGKGALLERVMLRMEEQAIDLERQALRAEEVEADTKLAALLRERAVLLRQEMALRKGIASQEVLSEQRAASEKSAQVA